MTFLLILGWVGWCILGARTAYKVAKEQKRINLGELVVFICAGPINGEFYGYLQSKQIWRRK